MNSLLKHTYWIFGIAAVVASIALVGCGSKDNGAAAVAQPLVVPLTTGTPGSNGYYIATNLSITDEGAFRLLLQNGGLCSPAFSYTFGSASCRTYSGAGYLVVQLTGGIAGVVPTAANATLGAGARAPKTPNENFMSGGAVLRPTFYGMAIGPANNSQGFVAMVVNGPQNGFRFVVNSGFPGTGVPLNVDLVYSGIVFARGTLYPQ